MKYRLLLQRLAIPLICLVAVLAHAEAEPGRLYWVVGSFPDQAVAVNEGARISRTAGLEVVYTVSDVEGSTYYRLLVPQHDHVDDQGRLKQQLDQAGIGKPWPLRVDDTLTRYLSASDSRPPSLYLVVGSFNRYEDAQLHVDNILENFNQVAELREFTTNGDSIIRVMTGPYADRAEFEVAKELFRDGNMADAWPIKLQPESQDRDTLSDYESYEDVDYLDLPESDPDLEQIPREPPRGSIRVPENTINPGYNLATLKRKDQD